jgi:hypothetical protein
LTYLGFELRIEPEVELEEGPVAEVEVDLEVEHLSGLEMPPPKEICLLWVVLEARAETEAKREVEPDLEL